MPDGRLLDRPGKGGYPPAMGGEVPERKTKPAGRAKMRGRPEVSILSKTAAVRVPRRQLERLVRFVARQQGQAVAAIDLAVVDRKEMAALNRRYLGGAGCTDVLSFDLSEAGRTGIVAQIILCGELAARQAGLRGHAVSGELMLYVVHGLLHLMGYEDGTAAGAARMHAREDELLSGFGAGAAFARGPRRRPK